MSEESEDEEIETFAALATRLAALPEPSPPADLLGRCLATLPGSPARRSPRPLRELATARLTTAAAALLVVGVCGWLAWPRAVDAADVLKAGRAVWAEVPASHQVVRISGPATEGGSEESWFVRGRGRRHEIRRGTDPRPLVEVDNGRWRFRIDGRTGLVAAWSSELRVESPSVTGSGLLIENESFLRWAEAQRGSIRLEREILDAIETRKIVVRWPGETEGVATPREQTVWFDLATGRPRRQRIVYGDGQVVETRVYYPAPQSIAADLFDYIPPLNAALEITDPDLGRTLFIPAPAVPPGDPR